MESEEITERAVLVDVQIWPVVPGGGDIDRAASRTRFASILKKRLAARYPNAVVRVEAAAPPLRGGASQDGYPGCMGNGVTYEQGWRHDSILELYELNKIDDVWANVHEGIDQWVVRY